MTSSRRQFLTGAIALGATPLLAQDEPVKEPYVLDPSDILPHIDVLKKKWEAERRDNLDRAEICAKLERVLLARFMAPIDTWFHMEGYMKIPTLRKAADRLVSDEDNQAPIDDVWFLLKIRSASPLKGKDIWMKWSLINADRALVWTDDYEGGHNDDGTQKQKQVPEVFKDTIWRKRDSLLEALEHHFVQLLDDEECIHTMVDGTAHLYLIHGPEADPEKVTKEQLLA